VTTPKFKTIKAHDHINIRVAKYESTTAPIGVVQIIHGFGEGIGHYDDVIDFFTGHGYICVMHDQRGFGEMPDLTPIQRKSSQGIAPSYNHFLQDIKILYNNIRKWYPTLPVILFGHSMGGNIVSNHLLEHAKDYDKAIIQAPWLRLYNPMPKIAVPFAKLIGKFSTKIKIKAKLGMHFITRDKDKLDKLLKCNFFHTKLSLKLFAEISIAGEYAIIHAAQIPIPTLLLIPGGDKIVCVKAIREFAVNAGSNFHCIEYPDAYHALHSDIIRDEVLNAMLTFCKI